MAARVTAFEWWIVLLTAQSAAASASGLLGEAAIAAATAVWMYLVMRMAQRSQQSDPERGA